MLRALVLAGAVSVAAAAPIPALNHTQILNGRPTNPGEWEGTVMVVGSNGGCEESGLCTGMFIHPEVVMTAGHCCGNGATKAICGGQLRPGRKLAESIAVFTDNSGNNDFCLLHLDVAVRDVPIYEVATAVTAGQDAIIVGYGVVNSGSPQTGSGVAREGLVEVDRIGGSNDLDIHVMNRAGQSPYQNSCNGDSGGPIFYTKPGSNDLVVGGVTSRGSAFCPEGGVSIYTSAVAELNANHITRVTGSWLGAGQEIVPGVCPVTFCCHSMECPV